MTTRSRWSLIALPVLAAAACGARGEPAPGSPQPADSTAAEPADSLLLSLADGATVWFAEGRPAADSAGTACFERTLEIRRDTVRVKVPLFYTRNAPTVLDDSTLRAELFRDCRVVGVYRVHLRTGAPTPLQPAGP
ncbi:MAG: hypothetical protein ACRENB_08890 [Gemmatimonadales bacterium]